MIAEIEFILIYTQSLKNLSPTISNNDPIDEEINKAIKT